MILLRCLKLFGLAVLTYLAIRLLGALNWGASHELCFSQTSPPPLGWTSSRALALIDACIASPLAEEYIFRKWLIQWLEKHIAPIYALIISAICFYIAHIFVLNSAIDAFPIFVLGMVLGAAFLRKRRVGNSFAVHALYNTILVSPKASILPCFQLSPGLGFVLALTLAVALIQYIRVSIMRSPTSCRAAVTGSGSKHADSD